MKSLVSEERMWNNALPAFSKYEKTRWLFRPATKKIVEQTLVPFLTKGKKVIEIGAGLGELAYNLLPANKRHFLQQTEQGTNLIAQQKKLHPTSNVIQANVYRLPFAQNSCDCIVGFSSFDTFLDITAAVKELRRILKKGGTLMHFLDLRACPEVLLRPYIDNPTHTLLPTLSRKKIVGPFLQIERTFLKKYLHLHPVAYKKSYHMFLYNPEKAYDTINRKDPAQFERLAYEVHYLFEGKYDTKIINDNTYFFQRYKKALIKNGFAIESFGIKEASAVISKPSSIAESFPTVNCAIHDLERTEYWNSSSIHIAPGKLAVISCMHVAVARKR